MKLKVWTFVSDTETGTDVITFASEAKLDRHLAEVIITSYGSDAREAVIEGVGPVPKRYVSNSANMDAEDESVLALINEGKIDEAFDLWKDGNYVGHLDTYTWDVCEIEIPDLKVTIEVQGGVAETTNVPPGVEVEIIDHDNARVNDVEPRCPDCDEPNQFGELCPSCLRDRAMDAAAPHDIPDAEDIHDDPRSWRHH